MLILAVAKDFDKLLENCSLTAIAALSKLGRVMIVAVDFSVMFIVAVLGAEDGGADGASEMFDMVFAFQSSDI